ncbi:MAG: putative Ig domain-containing protein [bacterium]
MNRSRFVSLLVGALAFGASNARATTVIGTLNNFDTLCDVGERCYGFEIEIDDCQATSITYTYDWNHYGAPQITEDNTDPAHPKVFVRYHSLRDGSGNWGANGTYTNVAIPTPTPPAGHSCTNPAVNEGCEHFGVGYYGATSTIKYNWLVIGPTGELTPSGSPVAVSSPSWVYTPPVGGQPAQVVPAIPAPAVPIPPVKRFGQPSFVKVIKTTTHNANDVVLDDLISDDVDGDGLADWQNAEPSEVESEFYLLQTNDGANGAKQELVGGADHMGDGSENVTRRYEFYEYGAAADTIDGETGEAMCDEVNPTTDPANPLYLHGVGTNVAVTDANGDTYYVNCEAQVVVGNYIGAQMAGFDADAGLGLVDHLQDGESGIPYLPRTVVVGGNRPYAIGIQGGALPPGLTLGDYVDPQSGDTLPGVLFGTPTAGGDFSFTVDVTDASNTVVSHAYTLHVVGPPGQLVDLMVSTQGTGVGTVSGNGIDCGATCATQLDVGTSVTLTATPDSASGSLFSGWGGPCAGTGICAFTITEATTVTASFTQGVSLSVVKSGAGTGTVTGGGIDCGATCSAWVEPNAIITLAATPAVGSSFLGWSGAGCTGTGTCAVTMDAAKSVTATFGLDSFALTVAKAGKGVGTVTSSPAGISCGATCSASFAAGTLVTLTATTTPGNTFTGWSGACSGTGTCQVTMDAERSVTATFKGACGAIGSPGGTASVLVGLVVFPMFLRRRSRTVLAA